MYKWNSSLSYSSYSYWVSGLADRLLLTKQIKKLWSAIPTMKHALLLIWEMFTVEENRQCFNSIKGRVKFDYYLSITRVKNVIQFSLNNGWNLVLFLLTRRRKVARLLLFLFDQIVVFRRQLYSRYKAWVS